MKKFIFSLERILGFKRTLFEKERNTLAHLRALRAALQQRRNNTETQMGLIDAAFRAKAETGVRLDEVNQVNYHRDNSDKLIRQLEEEMAEKDVEIAHQLKIVIALDQDVKGLEKLREKQWAEHSALEARDEQERIMEMVSAQYIEEQNAAKK